MRIRSTTLIGLAVLALAWADLAGATTYYVSPSGSGSSAGTQAAPWSLSKANSALVAGDVAILAPGDYGSTSIMPANDGTSYSRRITFVGSLNNPSSTTVQSVTLVNDYLTVKGIKYANSISCTGSHDSLSWCVSTSGGIGFSTPGSDNVVSRCSLAGSSLHIVGTDTLTTKVVARDTLQDCTLTLNLNGYGPCIRFLNTYGIVFDRCRFFMTIGPSGDHGTWKLYGAMQSRFTDCLFDITQNHDPNAGGCDECGQSYIRDMSRFNVWKRDTFNLRGPYTNQIFLTASGAVPGSVYGNKWDGCVFRQEAPTGAAAIYWQNGARNDTLINSVVIGKGCDVFAPWNIGGNCVIKNNTFVSVDHSPTGMFFTGWSGSAVCQNNIFYSAGANPAAKFQDGAYRGDYNLYYAAGGSASSAVTVTGTSSTVGPLGKLCTAYGEDCHSIAADPMLVGGSTVWNFDPHLRSGSRAIGAGLSGVDLGAVPFGSGVTDTAAPFAVTDLAVSQINDNSLVLTWTATGDDGMVGQAAAYELHMSGVAITPANFGAATVLAIAIPVFSGQPQSFVVTGLTPGSVRFFALKTRDEASNWSPLSNVATAVTLAADTVPPGTVTDLNASP